MRTSEVLNTAADVLEQRGWVGYDCPGNYDTWGWGENLTGPICIEGGILAALGRPSRFTSIEIERCPAGRAISDYLDRHETCALWRWNDVEGRTAAEVIEVLRACAVIEAAREQRPAEVSA